MIRFGSSKLHRRTISRRLEREIRGISDNKSRLKRYDGDTSKLRMVNFDIERKKREERGAKISARANDLIETLAEEFGAVLSPRKDNVIDTQDYQTMSSTFNDKPPTSPISSYQSGIDIEDPTDDIRIKTPPLSPKRARRRTESTGGNVEFNRQLFEQLKTTTKGDRAAWSQLFAHKNYSMLKRVHPNTIKKIEELYNRDDITESHKIAIIRKSWPPFN